MHIRIIYILKKQENVLMQFNDSALHLKKFQIKI